MGEPKDDERDEEWFKEVYGQGYTGPIRSANEISHDKSSVKKRSMTEASDEDESPPDPNAVPTDFTSREAKVWESKAKAIERNWKKKKEEELICRICGEYGHFSQGCPSTLGANLKQQREIVEKIPVKDKRLKPRIIGTGGSVIQGIEKDTGCRLKLEDNLASGSASFFVRISGSSRGTVGKAVDAVKKLLDQVQHERKPQGSQRSHGSHNRGSSMNSVGSVQIQHMPNQPSRHEQSYPGQDLPYYGDGQYGGMEQMNQVDSRRQWEGGNQNGSFAMTSYGHKGGEDHVAEVDVGYTEQQPITSTIETLEHKFVQETMQLTKELNDAEDKENARHREAMREIQEQYQQKMVTLRSQQGKRREEFLRQETHFRQQKFQQYQPNAPPQSGQKYYDYDSSGGFGNNNRDKLGYGNLVDRNDGVITTGGSYDSYRGEGGYHNSSRSYRSSGYDAPVTHSRSQGYDAGQYRY